MSPAPDPWTTLKTAAAKAAKTRIVDLFAAEPGRLERLTLDAAGLHLDLSKQPWDDTVFDAALAHAEASGLLARRDALFDGDVVNPSEGRAALHVALRAPKGAAFNAQREPVSAAVETSRAAVLEFAEKVRDGVIRTASGETFNAVLHIGIGGSDLGPRLVWQALKPVWPSVDVVFAANVDGAEFEAATAGLDPRRTLVVVVSKTFTTQETMANAGAARAWLAAALGEDKLGAHLAAVSTALDQTRAFGVADDRVFGFWDWVGGRYSLWSAVGLSCAIGLGAKAFQALLAGAAAMDEHFRTAPLARNGPVLLALSHILNRNGLGRPVRAVVPYARRLALLPGYLQQLEMESNGKGVDLSGQPTALPGSATVFGDVGTNAQHAFFQALHQGADIIPVDFVAAIEGEGPPDHQAILLANCLAQAEALMVGQDAPGLSPERRFSGDRPSNLILLPRVDPTSVGALLALYEHKTFVEGALWGVNSFDQWGVELGKSLAAKILPELTGGPVGPHDPSTAALIARVRKPRD